MTSTIDASCAPLNRIRTTPVSTEISDATNSLLHFSLSPDLRSFPTASTSHLRRAKTQVGKRRSSLEDLRLPPGSVATAEEAEGDEDGRRRHSGNGSGNGMGKGGKGKRRNESEGGDEEAGEGPADLPEFPHPFAGTSTLLRRCNSDQDLTMEDQGDDDDFESDEEPFRIRPPSIASSVTSQRSSRFGVRIQDRSDRETKCFAVDAQITGFYSVGEKAGGFVVFDCEIRTREGTCIRTLKRYSAFVSLREALLAEFPKLKPLIPRLPPKSSLAKFRPSFLERRRQHLSFWLTTILLHPETGGCGTVRTWILS